MPFRDGQPPIPVRRVVLGPHPVRRGRIFFAVLVGILVGGFPLLGARALRLTCVRASRGAAACTLVERGPILPDLRRTFRDADVVELRVRQQSGAWAVALTDGRGVETVLAERDERPAAERVLARLQAFTRGRAAPGFVVTTPADRAPFFIAALAVAIALGLALHSLRGGARFRVEADPQNDALRIVRTWFLLPRERWSLRLADVADVELERGEVTDALATHRAPPEPGGRLVLVLRDGHRIPLSAQMLRGPAVLERSFAALRSALELPVVAPPRPPAPATVAASPKRTWLLFAVMGIVVIGAMLAYLLADGPDPNTGRLDLAADVRCKFQGMELLPGGRVETRLPAGEYPLRVWDSSAPDHWQERTVRIRAGMTTETRCSAP